MKSVLPVITLGLAVLSSCALIPRRDTVAYSAEGARVVRPNPCLWIRSMLTAESSLVKSPGM